MQFVIPGLPEGSYSRVGVVRNFLPRRRTQRATKKNALRFRVNREPLQLLNYIVLVRRGVFILSVIPCYDTGSGLLEQLFWILLT